MQIHGLRPEFQPEAINEKLRATAQANKQADNPVRGHGDVVPPVQKSVQQSNRLLDIKG